MDDFSICTLFLFFFFLSVFFLFLFFLYLSVYDKRVTTHVDVNCMCTDYRHIHITVAQLHTSRANARWILIAPKRLFCLGVLFRFEQLNRTSFMQITITKCNLIWAKQFFLFLFFFFLFNLFNFYNGKRESLNDSGIGDGTKNLWKLRYYYCYFIFASKLNVKEKERRRKKKILGAAAFNVNQ